MRRIGGGLGFEGRQKVLRLTLERVAVEEGGHLRIEGSQSRSAAQGTAAQAAVCGLRRHGVLGPLPPASGTRSPVRRVKRTARRAGSDRCR